MSLYLVIFLILFPLIGGAILFFVKEDKVRDPLVYLFAGVIALASVILVVAEIFSGPAFFVISSVVVDYLCSFIGVVIAAVILYFAVTYKNVLAGILAVVQVIAALIFEFFFAHSAPVMECLYFDTLSLIMAVIIGVIGSGICVYALGYMKDFQKHADEEGEKDRRPFFFGIMFLFLGAMYMIVFSNNMTWMFTGWEITTLCSFLLIGYTRTEEAIANAFRQIIMNLYGGLAFAAALYFSYFFIGTLDLQTFIENSVALAYMGNPIIVSLPVILLAFAAITKAAQMPFHTWLLGAMVAPTPTSALLHSSTMVKAGVFLLVKLAPIMSVCILPASMTVLVGGITFMLCSFMAISQTNAKRVLAYSTIANLGLITACCGVGTPEAVWAAIFLIVFHAIAKSLLFLCVGTAEHHIGSRDIESMDLLFERMPRLARYMMVGIMCMFIAPFGMLIAKWATLVSFIDARQFVVVALLAFGSAATFMFWAKWLGKLAGIAGNKESIELTVHKSEWIATTLMIVLAVLACVTLPLLSDFVVWPYLATLYILSTIPVDAQTLWITAALCAFIFIVLFVAVGKKKDKPAQVYLSGVSADNIERTFRGSMGESVHAQARNWYLEGVFGEDIIRPLGSAGCIAIMVIAFLFNVILIMMQVM